MLISEMELFAINDIILSIYSTADINQMRKEFLDRVRSLIPYDVSAFLCENKQYKNSLSNPEVCINISEKEIKEYERKYSQMDYANWMYAQPESMVYRDTDLMKESIRVKTKFFQEFIVTRGMYFSGGAVIIEDKIFLGQFCLWRSKANGDFSDKELLIMKLIVPHIKNRLFEFYNDTKKNSDSVSYIKEKYALTNAEINVIKLTIEGLRNSEIAERLNISLNTVKKHMYNIFKKCNVNNRNNLIKLLT